MKKRKFDNYNNITVSASHIYNYMNNDYLIDWLKLYKKESYCKDEFTDFICNKGNEFETKLVDYINNNKVPIHFVSKYIDDESCNRTIELMMQGIPILYSAPVKNNINNTQGIIDLLIRSDYLNQLVDIVPLKQHQINFKAPNLNGNYHYVVINIKFSSLKLRADGKHLLNSGKQPFYKGQIKIYTDAIGIIQGYTCPYGFIIGRKYIYGKEYIVNNSLYTLGKVDYDFFDKDYIYSTQKAIEWVRIVKSEGHLWSISPPSRFELYPNMCIDSGPWMKEKRRIANEINEITSIWNCRIKNRNFAIQNNILSWNNPNCITSNLNINNNYSKIIDSILNINRQTEINILPNKIQNNYFNWKERDNEIFLDFETISDIFGEISNLPLQNNTELIFMIGIGHINNEGIFEYKKFICNDLTKTEESKIMDDFISFLENKNNPKIYYWSAEPSIWKRAEIRNNKNKLNLKWCDLYKIFREEPIVIRGCMDFSLKSIAKMMKNHNMISSSLESNCDSGMVAMLKCWKYYNENRDNSIMQDIIQYNEFDCKVLFEILEYLKNNMI